MGGNKTSIIKKKVSTPAKKDVIIDDDKVTAVQKQNDADTAEASDAEEKPAPSKKVGLLQKRPLAKSSIKPEPQKAEKTTKSIPAAKAKVVEVVPVKKPVLMKKSGGGGGGLAASLAKIKS